MGSEKKLKGYCETTFWSYLVGRQTTDEKIARDQSYDDPLEEIYAIRREISEQYGHDNHRLFEGFREWQREQKTNGVKFNFAPLPIVRHQSAMACRFVFSHTEER